MNKMSRGDAPEFLKTNAEKWTQMYLKSGSFHWHGKHEELVIELSKLTANHCCFCDILPVSKGEIRPTVEHFHPKSNLAFYHLAFSWDNLFLCCDQCQTYKLEKFEAQLLKPDEPDYEFEKYFYINFRDGILKPRVDQTPDNKQRADITIRIYGLNEDNRPVARRRELNRFNESYTDKKEICGLKNIPFNPSDYPALELDNYSYRFYIQFFNGS
jgi:uncharacterized protein (TIGR02646 family)